MSLDLAERELLERLKPDLEAEGFEVFLAPNPMLLPKFLVSSPPDAIAIRIDKKLALEVVRPSPQPSTKLAHLTKLLAGHEDWELRVFLVNVESPEAISVERASTINARLLEFRELLAEGHAMPALLLGWAAFEAICRALMPLSLQKAQTPGRLIEIAAREGYVAPSEADLLRRLAKLRNEFVHGGLDAFAERSDMMAFVEVLERLIGEIAE